jgi:type III secretory pathway component EscU
MAGVMTFITVVEKILIIISIICFIPTSVFVFAPKNYTYTTEQINSYNNAYQQVFTPFIVGFNSNNCTSK